MRPPLLPAWSEVRTPVIGMVHLAALPGSPRFGGDRPAIDRAMRRDADALVSGGAHGLMLENFGDRPFHPGPVPAHVVASMTELGARLRAAHPDIPLGINVLRNDGLAALAIAAAIGACFIRVNVLCGVRVTDQGLVHGIAHDLLRERARLGATAVHIWADVDVKHSMPLCPWPAPDEAVDTVQRGLADAVIVSGPSTGRAVSPRALEAVRAAVPAVPLLVGSGVTADTAAELGAIADGLIVGTWLKCDGLASAPIDASRVRALIRSLAAPGRVD